MRPVSLDDKYDLTKSPVFVTGYQALIRLEGVATRISR